MWNVKQTATKIFAEHVVNETWVVQEDVGQNKNTAPMGPEDNL
jgi:hypothetical protein